VRNGKAASRSEPCPDSSGRDVDHSRETQLVSEGAFPSNTNFLLITHHTKLQQPVRAGGVQMGGFGENIQV
jgi:hypothetical protein